MALQHQHCFGVQRKEDARGVVVEGLSLVAWGRHLVTLLSQGLAHLLLRFVVRDSEKSRPATGTYVKQSRELELPLRYGTGESPKREPCGLCDSALLAVVRDSGGIWVPD